jgi:hypothetical protein
MRSIPHGCAPTREVVLNPAQRSVNISNTDPWIVRAGAFTIQRCSQFMLVRQRNDVLHLPKLLFIRALQV